VAAGIALPQRQRRPSSPTRLPGLRPMAERAARRHGFRRPSDRNLRPAAGAGRARRPGRPTDGPVLRPLRRAAGRAGRLVGNSPLRADLEGRPTLRAGRPGQQGPNDLRAGRHRRAASRRATAGPPENRAGGGRRVVGPRAGRISDEPSELVPSRPADRDRHLYGSRRPGHYHGLARRPATGGPRAVRGQRSAFRSARRRGSQCGPCGRRADRRPARGNARGPPNARPRPSATRGSSASHRSRANPLSPWPNGRGSVPVSTSTGCVPVIPAMA